MSKKPVSEAGELVQFNTRILSEQKKALKASVPDGYSLQQLLNVMSKYWLGTPKSVRDQMITAESGSTPWTQGDSPFDSAVRKIAESVYKEKFSDQPKKKK